MVAVGMGGVPGHTSSTAVPAEGRVHRRPPLSGEPDPRSAQCLGHLGVGRGWRPHSCQNQACLVLATCTLDNLAYRDNGARSPLDPFVRAIDARRLEATNKVASVEKAVKAPARG